MRFTPNQPVTLRQPTVVVDPGLPPGRHRFQLVVVGASGRRSQPVEVVVVVSPRTTPPIPGPPLPPTPP